MIKPMMKNIDAREKMMMAGIGSEEPATKSIMPMMRRTTAI